MTYQTLRARVWMIVLSLPWIVVRDHGGTQRSGIVSAEGQRLTNTCVIIVREASRKNSLRAGDERLLKI